MDTTVWRVTVRMALVVITLMESVAVLLDGQENTVMNVSYSTELAKVS